MDESLRESMIYGNMIKPALDSSNIENDIKQLAVSLDIDDKALLKAFIKEIAILLVQLVADIIKNHIKKANIKTDLKPNKKNISNQFSIVNIRELKPFEDKKNGDIYYAFKFTIKLSKKLIKDAQMTSVPTQTIVFKNNKIFGYGNYVKYKSK